MNSVPSLYSRGAKWLTPALRSEQMHRPVGKETTQLFWQLPDQATWLRGQKTCQRRGGWMAPSNPLCWEKGTGKLGRSGKGSTTPTWSAPGWGHLSTAALRPAFGLGTHVEFMGQRGRYSNVTADAGSTQGLWVQSGRTHWVKRTPSSPLCHLWPTSAFAQGDIGGDS